ncbi:hypothetical protein FRB96_004389 [Tulasnella sp. 330]|nr:hypothetical protein FRB96_004389 [Tulasnella sp. 330]KAG8870096.1 hypothetical protein FRB97_000335 [Tulasnella sp. 331]
MDLDYSDIEAVRQLPPSLKDTIRRILPYMGEDRLETIINDVREGHVSTVSPEGGIAPRIASGSQRLIMAGEDDTTVSIQ